MSNGCQDSAHHYVRHVIDNIMVGVIIVVVSVLARLLLIVEIERVSRVLLECLLLATTMSRSQIITNYNNASKSATIDYVVFVMIRDLLIAIMTTHE